MDPFYVELREFIRRLRLTEEDEQRIRRDIRALRTGIDSASSALNPGMNLPSTYQLQGTITSCGGSSTRLPNAVITITDATSGYVYLTLSANSSGLFGPITFSGPASVLHGMVTVAPDPTDFYAPRFVTPTPFAVTLNPLPTTNSVFWAGPNAASGFHCIDCSNYPLQSVLNFSDTGGASGTLTYGATSPGFSLNGAGQFWTNTSFIDVDFVGRPPNCIASANMPSDITFFRTSGFGPPRCAVDYFVPTRTSPVNPSFVCPWAAGFYNLSTAFLDHSTIVSITYNPIVMTFTMNSFLYGVPTTVTLSE